MTDTNAPAVGQTYRIGAVARLTGIPPDTLRVWERRYAVVTPVRSEAGTRLYHAEDVSRLNLIKRLVDNGDAISHVARLSLEHLRQRAQGLDTPAPALQEAHPCRVAVLGPSLPVMIQTEPCRDQEQTEAQVQFVGLYTEESVFRDQVGRLGLDLLVLECPTIHDDQLRQLADLAVRSGAPRTLVIYNYASREVVGRLEAQHMLAKRAPVNADELRRWCGAMHVAGSGSSAALLADFDLSAPPPARLYDAAALSRIAAASPTVKCECPHHLVQLVSSLVAFETYSRECENRNADDAALHAFLHAATAQARATMEAALARVVEAEGIDV
ncbi:MerR family transcriptional regulator [uncultured Thiohalocapsa sp.]|uniref:MerR family transcriptional regulator n=1 Tax=uncultured Thiohalocapsa sp. TaxID=768990 RepID=UPI0025E19CC5|nr:MerR family transcriptional regulator [uncultured Thiohalocapsa sp.]